MPIESPVNNINELNPANPLLDDPVSEGDDHIRLIKTALTNNFAGIGGNVTATHNELNYLDIAVLGTAAASKALVADGSAQINASAITFTDLGTVTTADINGGTWQGTIDGTWTAAGQTCTNLGTVSGATSITSSAFVGPLTGNADTATTATTATGATNVNVNATTSTDATAFPLLVGAAATGNQLPFIDNLDLSYNANTGALSATSFVGSLTASGGTIDSANIGATTPGTGAFTTLSATGNVTLGDGAADTVTVNGTIQGANPFIFEGGAADANELTLAIPSLSADATITMPNATDTLVGRASTDTLTNKTIDANGTGNVISNIDIGNCIAASQAEAEAGTDNTKLLTSLRVAQAIAAQSGGGFQSITGYTTDQNANDVDTLFVEPGNKTSLVVLPAKSTGDMVDIFANASAYDACLKMGTGEYSKIVAPHTLVRKGTSRFYVDQAGAYGTTAWFEMDNSLGGNVDENGAGVSPACLSIAKIATNKFVRAGMKQNDEQSLDFQVGSISGDTITWGTTQTHSLFSDMGVNSMVSIATDKFICLFEDDVTTMRLKAIAGSVSGTTISLGTEIEIAAIADASSLPGALGRVVDVDKVTTDTAIAVWHNEVSLNVESCILTVSGTTITENTNYVVDSVTGSGVRAVAVAALSSTLAVCVYTSNSTSIEVAAGTISGTTITWGTPVALSAKVTGDQTVALIPVSATKFCVIYQGASTPIAVNCTVSGTTITKNTDYTTFATDVYNESGNTPTLADNFSTANLSGTEIFVMGETGVGGVIDPSGTNPTYVGCAATLPDGTRLSKSNHRLMYAEDANTIVYLGNLDNAILVRDLD